MQTFDKGDAVPDDWYSAHNMKPLLFDAPVEVELIGGWRHMWPTRPLVDGESIMQNAEPLDPAQPSSLVDAEPRWHIHTVPRAVDDAAQAPNTPLPDEYIEEGRSVSTKAELEMLRLRQVMYDVARTAATLGTGSDGWLRGRFMSISNALNAAIGRQQSSHGDQFDTAGKITRPDPLNDRI